MEKLLILGGILKRIGNINMKLFKEFKKERMKFQKTVYFLKIFGFDWGHAFNFYLYGPYSPSLAKDGYKLAEISGDLKELKFLDDEIEKKFKELLEFLGPRKNDAKWLELLSSIHFLKMAKKNKEEIRMTILGKKTIFNENEFREGWVHLRKFGLLGDDA